MKMLKEINMFELLESDTNEKHICPVCGKERAGWLMGMSTKLNKIVCMDCCPSEELDSGFMDADELRAKIAEHERQHVIAQQAAQERRKALEWQKVLYMSSL